MKYIIDDVLTFFRQNYLTIISLILSVSLLIVFVITNYFKEPVESGEISINNEVETIKENTEPENKAMEEAIKVDIKGEVINPGVYAINNDQTVQDVINIAGGLTKKANTNDINLSKKVTNEMVIIVPTISEKKESKPNITNNAAIPSNSTSTEKNTSKKISINTGTLNELMTLTGIGEAKAKSIISYREKNGLFKKIEDIKNVTGIGDALFAKIKENITI